MFVLVTPLMVPLWSLSLLLVSTSPRAQAHEMDQHVSLLQTTASLHVSVEPTQLTSASGQLRFPQVVARPRPSQLGRSTPSLGSLAMAQSNGSHAQPRPGSGACYRQVMSNSNDVQYVASIVVGNQEMMGVLDTGSFELVVFSDECNTCGTPGELYEHTRSSTWEDGRLIATHHYGSGDVESIESFDSVRIGPLAASHQKFWEVTDAKMPVLSSSSFQSIVGVGPPNVPTDEAWQMAKNAEDDIKWFRDNKLPVPKEIKQDVKDSLEVAKWTAKSPALLDSLGVRLFSVCLGDVPGSDGYFIWNDADPRQRPEMFTPLPVAGDVTWGVQMWDVQLSSEERGSGKKWSLDLGCAGGCSAVVDSGTSLLAVPPVVITELERVMESLHTDCSNLHDMPRLSFRAGGQVFSLPPDAYIGQIVGTVPESVSKFLPQRSRGGEFRKCELLLIEQDSNTQFGPLWILGMPFFRKYYTTFDVGENKKGRSLFTALADSRCEPSMDAAGRLDDSAALLASKPRLRQVDGSKLRVPSWIGRAKENKFMAI